jgi:O-6-methylguanine DNA methyltransferase
MNTKTIYEHRWITPLGEMQALGTQEAVYCLSFLGEEVCKENVFQKSEWEKKSDQPCYLLKELQKQIEAYFAKKHRQFEIPICLVGTHFQKTVWSSVQNLAYGEKCSYRDQAQSIGNPNAYRAVGHAISKNPLALLIPCHRVVSVRSQNGGYRWGMQRKTALLDHERESA